MNIQFSRKVLLILLCAILILAIYSIDLFKLNYRFMGWKLFGQIPIEASHIQYFVPDIPNVIGYRESGSGELVSCATTVAYLKTTADETYRCCDTGNKISCLGGNFSSDFPTLNQECKNRLQELFAIPVSVVDSKDYQMFAHCQEGDNVDIAEVAVVQIDKNGQLLWKHVSASQIAVIRSGLKCILAPLLLILMMAIIIMTVRGKTKEPIRRLW